MGLDKNVNTMDFDKRICYNAYKEVKNYQIIMLMGTKNKT